MKRKIRLTESEFHSLIKRLVIETQEEMNMSDDMSMSDDKETNYDPTVIRRIARFFKQKLRRLDDEEIEDLQDMVLNPKTENLAEMFLREDISDRMKSFKEKAMMRGGVGMMGAGMLGMISQAMGYTDAGELMTQVHDYVDMMGGGPVSTAVLIAGLVMALKGTADRSERLGK
jgi:hypothetical protein